MFFTAPIINSTGITSPKRNEKTGKLLPPTTVRILPIMSIIITTTPQPMQTPAFSGLLQFLTPIIPVTNYATALTSVKIPAVYNSPDESSPSLM